MSKPQFPELLLPKTFTEIEVKWWSTHTSYSNKFKKSEIKKWNTIKLNGTYKFDDSKLQLTDREKDGLSKRWWNIVPGDRYEKFYKLCKSWIWCKSWI